MEADSMINMPNMAFDDKIGNKRVRDGEEEIHKGRLEKRPSGILGVSGGEGYIEDGSDEGRANGGIIDTFISNVFQKNKSGTEGEVEDDVEEEVKTEDLGVDGDGGEGGGIGGGGMISAFFSNIFQHNGSVDEGGDQAKSDHLLDENAEKTGHLGGTPGGGGGEPEDLKLGEKKDDNVVDLSSKDPKGHGLKVKPDDYSERVFFLNNN